MVGKIKNLFKNPVFSGLIFVSLGTVISTFLNYYFNFLTQSLFPDFKDFGDFVFILSFLALSQIIPGSVIGTLNLIVTELKVKNEFAKLTNLYIRMLVLFSIVGLSVGSLIFLIANPLAETFKIQNPFYIQMLGVLVFLATAGSPVSSFLYGLLKFKSYSFLLIFSVLAKIIFMIWFFRLGYGFNSIFYGYIVSSIFSFVIGNLLLITHFDPKYKLTNVSEFTKRLILFSLPLLLIGVGNSFLNQLDFLIIKNKLDVVSSGMYGYLVNFGKIFDFGSLIFCGAMAPQVTESLNKKENYFKILFFYLKIVLPSLILGVVALCFFTTEFLDIFISITSKLGLKIASLMYFYQIKDYIPLYTIFTAIYILINFFTIFLIATSVFKIYMSYIFAIIAQGTLIFTLATDINTTVYCNIFVSGVLLLYLLYEIYKRYTNFNYSSNL